MVSIARSVCSRQKTGPFSLWKLVPLTVAGPGAVGPVGVMPLLDELPAPLPVASCPEGPPVLASACAPPLPGARQTQGWPC